MLKYTTFLTFFSMLLFLVNNENLHVGWKIGNNKAPFQELSFYFSFTPFFS